MQCILLWKTCLCAAQQEEELTRQLTLYPGKPRPAPAPPAAHVRLNAAAILREDTVYRKKQLQEAEMIKRCAPPRIFLLLLTCNFCELVCPWQQSAACAVLQSARQSDTAELGLAALLSHLYFFTCTEVDDRHSALCCLCVASQQQRTSLEGHHAACHHVISFPETAKEKKKKKKDFTRLGHLLCLPHLVVRRFEAELRDSSKHDSWQREAVAADLAARAAAVRQRRDEMVATQEAAMQARHQLMLDNLQAGHQMKVLTLVVLLPC